MYLDKIYREHMVVAKKNIENLRKEFIQKGSNISSQNEAPEYTNICLRIPKTMIHQIDKKTRELPGYSRNTWILQALHEKLKTEERESISIPLMS